MPKVEENSDRRLVSLDCFRGLTIASMMLVNNPGSDAVYSELDHALWNGWTFTDTVFPFFLWIVGVAITLSLARRLRQGASRPALVRQIIRRSLLLGALGFFLAGFPYFHLQHIRYLGVLQRISICYLISALLFVLTRWRAQLAAVVVLYGIYSAAMLLVPVPGLSASIGVGRFSQDANFARSVDGMLLAGHMWSHTRYWDPEGVVSTLPAIGSTLLGVLAGHLLRSEESARIKLRRLLWSGLGCGLLGLLCTHWEPINKNLWTVSFSLWMGALAFAEFALLFWLLDIKRWRGWSTPFVIYGRNAITLFVRLLGLISVPSGVTRISLHDYVFEHAFAPWASPRNASLLFACAMVLLLYAIAYLLYRRGWLLRV